VAAQKFENGALGKFGSAPQSAILEIYGGDQMRGGVGNEINC